jgi:hypothetical protein
MDQSPDPIPATWAAYQVVGVKGDTTIEALRADGTIYEGSIVLRITVEDDREFATHSTVACYEYDYRNRQTSDTPKHLSRCPTAAALQLSAPPPEPDFSDESAARLTAVLVALSPAQRENDTILLASVRSAFGPPAVVSGGRTSATDSFVSIRSFGVSSVAYYRCMIATVPFAGSPKVILAHGADCVGG